MIRFCWLIGLALVVGTALLGGGCTEGEGEIRQTRGDRAAGLVPGEPAFPIRSVTLDARREPPPGLLRHLRRLGVTHITLVPFGWQSTTEDPYVTIDTSDGWYSESHRGIRTLARQADTLGMDIIIKPHIWIGGYEHAQDRSEIHFDSEARWARWERSYTAFLMTYARLAAEVDAEILVLGTELRRVATRRPSFWRGLADTVKEVYDGDLTYAANWHEEYRKITFWDALDYVGVQAYFPLASTPKTTAFDTLSARWAQHRASLKTVHERTDRPVLFTEIGYRSAQTAASAPWEWPQDGPAVPPDSTLQAQCYRAFLSTMDASPWFAGAVVWKWHPSGRRKSPTAFTPQGKPAERVLYRWFTGTHPQVPLAFERHPHSPSARTSNADVDLWLIGAR